jgi:oligoendopeptidase F
MIRDYQEEMTMAEEIRKRSEIEEKYKWDLTHIYASDEAWEKDYQAAEAEIGTLSAFDGHVAEDPKKAIITVNETVEKIMPIYEYAFLRKETDNADSTAQGLKDRAMRLYVTAMTVTSFLEPELLEMPEEALKALAEDPEMRDYDAMLRRLLLSKPHTLPKEQERLIAMMGEVAEAPESIFSALSDADMKFPPVKCRTGASRS